VDRFFPPKEFNLDFGKALESLKAGRRISRDSWDLMQDRWRFLRLEEPCEHLSYSYIALVVYDVSGKITVTIWSPTQEDILSNDWMLDNEEY
jgi:hypothetical protein